MSTMTRPRRTQSQARSQRPGETDTDAEFRSRGPRSGSMTLAMDPTYTSDDNIRMFYGRIPVDPRRGTHPSMPSDVNHMARGSNVGNITSPTRRFLMEPESDEEPFSPLSPLPLRLPVESVVQARNRARLSAISDIRNAFSTHRLPDNDDDPASSTTRRITSMIPDVLLQSIVFSGPHLASLPHLMSLFGGEAHNGAPLIKRSSIKKRSTVLAVEQPVSTVKRKRKAAPRLTATKLKRAKRATSVEPESVPMCTSDLHLLTCAELSATWNEPATESAFVQLFSGYRTLGASCLCESGDRSVLDIDRIIALESELDWVTNIPLAESVASEVKDSLLPQLINYFETQSYTTPPSQFVDLSDDIGSPMFKSSTSQSSPAMLIDLTDDVDAVIEIDLSHSQSQNSQSQTQSQSSRSSSTFTSPPPESRPPPLTAVRRTRSQTRTVESPISLLSSQDNIISTESPYIEALSTIADASQSSSSSSSSSLSEAELVANSIIFLLEVSFLDENTSLRHSLFAVLSLVRCCEETYKLIISRLLVLSSERIVALIERIHHVLTESLVTADAINESVVGATQILSLIYDADVKHRKVVQSSPLLRDLSLLHNETVNTRVDLGEDEEFYNQSHRKYSRNTDAGNKDFRDSLRPSHFTFTQFAHFLLTVESKSKLLRRRIELRFVPEAVEDLRSQFDTDMMHRGGPRFNPHMTLNLTRQHLTRDFFNQISRLRDTQGISALIKPLRVQFGGEEGVDAGGLKRECLSLVCADLFQPAYGMFSIDDTTKFAYFNAFCQGHDSRNEMLSEFSMLGSVLGLAILNDVLLDLPFPPVVYKKLLGEKADFQDLEHSFPDYFNTLSNIMKYDEPDIEAALCLNFTVETSQYGVTHVHNLKPGGEFLAVNHENKKEYCMLYADYLLNESVAPMFNAFRDGFWAILPRNSILRFMQPLELGTVLCGKKVIDFKVLEKAAKYLGFSRVSGPSNTKPNVPVIKHLWSVLHSLSHDQKRAFLHFVTGQSSVPLNTLQLQISAGSDDVRMLPEAKTCFSTLVLPLYKTKAQLTTKLLIALEHATGFGNR